MKRKIHEGKIYVRPKVRFYIRIEEENGEIFKYISRDNKKFTKYKLMNKLYIRQKE